MAKCHLAAKKMPKKKTTPKSDPDPEMIIVGQRFRVAREDLGLSQTDLAKLVGGDQTRLSRFERGERGLSAGVLVRILQLFALRGIDLHRCLIGTGLGARDVVLAGEEPELVRELHEVVRRHLGNGGNGRNSPNKVERASKRRNKR
jgi:transcriptional regulator with XRE-family HTH domain